MDTLTHALHSGFWHHEPVVLTLALFVVVCALGVTLFVPKTVFAPAAGALFGLPAGLAAVIAGATAGCWLSLVIGRRLGRERVRAWLLRRHRLAELDRSLARHGVVPIAVLRMIPVLPASVVSYGSAATDIRDRHFLVGTVLGLLPMTLVQVAAGASLRDGLSTPVVSALGAGLLLVVGGTVWARSRRTAPALQPEPGDQGATRH